MKYTRNDNNLCIFLENRLDMSNVKDREQEINDIISNNTFDSLTLDLEELDYISSAGLRVILKLKKQNENFKIINANTEVYEIFDITGFTEIIDIKKAYRKLSIDSLEVIGRGAKGTIYRYNEDTVIKVYKNPDSIEQINYERMIAKKAFVYGVPTAISYDTVKVGDKYGSVFELLSSKSLTELIKSDKDNLDKYVKIFTSLLKELHSIKVKEDDFKDVKETITKYWLLDTLEVFSKEEENKLVTFIDSIENTHTLLHMDYHTNNILIQNDEAMLIDMDTMCSGNILFELANINATYLKFARVEGLVEGFLNIDTDLSKSIYDKFICEYLKDSNDFENTYLKVEVLSLLRLIRHLKRRDKDGIYKNIIDKAKVEVIDNLNKLLGE